MRQEGECKTGLMENTIFLELAVQEKQVDMNPLVFYLDLSTQLICRLKLINKFL
jgi:hypothetical protein